VKTVSDLWAAYESGGVDAVLERVGDEVVWQPDPFMGTVLRDPDALRAFATQAECPLNLLELEDHGQAVLMAVRLGSRDIHWVLHFRLGRPWRLASFAEREDAVGSLVALQAIAGPRFGGGERDGVVRVRGELDVATAASLENLLLRPREPGDVIQLDLSELAFMDSTGLRVLLRAQQAAVRGGWEVVLTGASVPVQRLFDLSGVHAALPRQAY
jgi:anti-anti-sigma factor